MEREWVIAGAEVRRAGGSCRGRAGRGIDLVAAAGDQVLNAVDRIMNADDTGE